MAGKVGDVQMTPDGYGFTIMDDNRPANSILISFGTQEQAEDARDLISDALDGALRVLGPSVAGATSARGGSTRPTWRR